VTTNRFIWSNQATLLEQKDIIELLEFILTTTYFSFRGQIYRQKFGTAMGSPVSPLVANSFMESLEQKLIATAPEDLKPKLWKRYVDDILEVVKRGSVDKLTEFLNTLDESGSIKFTYEVEQDGKLPFLDLLLVRTDSDGLKFLVYRKPTHTDQYLNFSSHHPVEHKLSVVRTLLERSQCMVSDAVDKKHEDAHIEDVLRVCGYPEWSFDKVKSQMEQKKQKKKQKKQEQSSSRPLVVIPYVEKTSEAVTRIMRKHNVPCTMRPCKTLRNILVHPKDKEETEQTSECVYKVPCASCEKIYVGETGRKLGVRLQEHRTEVESKTKRAFTRSQRSSTSAEFNRSALTDHAVQENHVINWADASVIDRESDRSVRWIKEAIHIRKEGQRAMNREEGSYQLSHAYDSFLGTSATYCAKNRKKN